MHSLHMTLSEPKRSSRRSSSVDLTETDRPGGIGVNKLLYLLIKIRASTINTQPHQWCKLILTLPLYQTLISLAVSGKIGRCHRRYRQQARPAPGSVSPHIEYSTIHNLTDCP